VTRLRAIAGGRATDGGETVQPAAAAPSRPAPVAAAEGQRLGVQLQGVSKWYGGLAAIRDLTLEVRSGEFLTLLGPSGSGKTTTLMMVAGFATPSAGRILIDGRDVTDDPPHRRGIGVVFQSYALFPHLTVARNVAFPLEARGVARRDIAPRVRRALDLVKLGDLAERYPAQLSGGQQQRVALARAFVFEPSLLLMDEPLGALDKKLRQHMQMELIKLKSQLDVTVIYVTHDQEEALVMSDRVVVMADGVIQQIGAPADLYSRPANRFVADFIGEANILDGTLRSAGEALVIEIADGTVLVAAGAPAAMGERVAVVVRPESVLLGPAAAACRNAFEGVVEQAIYVGDALRYVVQLPSGQSISARLPHRAGGNAIAVGDRIRLGWDVESAWVVPCEAALTGAARP
jgi:putative spermidine/putrescine transport system ATP-binding protein